MGFETTNIPHWWIDTQNDVWASFGVLLPTSITIVIHYLTILKVVHNNKAVHPDRVKHLTSNFFYYQLSMVLCYFSSSIFACFASWALAFFWINLHCLYDTKETEKQYKYTKYFRWTMVLNFFIWWVNLVIYFFEFAHP